MGSTELYHCAQACHGAQLPAAQHLHGEDRGSQADPAGGAGDEAGGLPPQLPGKDGRAGSSERGEAAEEGQAGRVAGGARHPEPQVAAGGSALLQSGVRAQAVHPQVHGGRRQTEVPRAAGDGDQEAGREEECQVQDQPSDGGDLQLAPAA